PVVALVRRCAAVAERSPADAIGAAVVHGAEEAVVAERAVGLKRGGAGTGRRITDAGGVAGVDGRTGDAVGAVADPGAAGVDLRAGVAVVAHAAVRLLGIRAGAGQRVTGAGQVTRVEWRADGGATHDADTAARPTGVVDGAGVAVVAARPVRVHVLAPQGGAAGVGGARVAVVAAAGGAAQADPRGAVIVGRAGVAVVAGHGHVLVEAAGRRIARIGRADIAVVTVG